MPGECQWPYPENPFLFMLALWPILQHVSISSVFSQNEKVYKDWRWAVFPGPLLPVRSFLRIRKDELEMQAVVLGEWRDSVQSRMCPFPWANTGKVEHRWIQLHSPSLQGAVGQWSHWTALALLWHGFHSYLEGQWWQTDEMLSSVLCQQRKIIHVLGFATIIISFFKVF